MCFVTLFKKPFYSIRFNTFEEIDEINIKIGNDIHFGEGFSEFVNVKYLLAQKGSDASWEHDTEVDDHHKVPFFANFDFQFKTYGTLLALSGAGVIDPGHRMASIPALFISSKYSLENSLHSRFFLIIKGTEL